VVDYVWVNSYPTAKQPPSDVEARSLAAVRTHSVG
jgi:hypothetical protein